MKWTTSQERFERKAARGMRQSGFRSTVALAFILMLAPAAFAANVLKDLQYESPDGQAVQVVVTAEQVFEKVPANFSITNPSRVVVDLPDTTTALETRHYQLSSGNVESIAAVEAAGRTRLVLNLREDVPYTLLTENNQLILSVGDIPAGTVLASSRPAATSSPAPAQSDTTTTAPAPSKAAPQGASVVNLDFRRTQNGGGKVALDFSASDLRIREQARVGHIVLEVAGVTVPEHLQKTFDVTDFATPVRSITIEPVGQAGARIDIRASGNYTHVGNQAGPSYTVEISPKVEIAQPTKKGPDEKTYEGQRVSLNFQDIEVRSVLQLLADFTGLNMVVSDTVGGNITLRLKDVPWDQALDIILQTKGLTSRRYGNVIMVAPIEEVTARERLELESEKQFEELGPLVSELIQVNYAQATALAEILKQEQNRLLSNRGNVTVDERTNTMLVQDTEQSLRQIRALVADLDRPVRQVLIESRVVIANDDFARELGVRFGFNGSDRGDDNSYLIAGGRPGHIGGTAGFAPGIENPADSGNQALMVNLPTVLGGERGGAINLLLGKVGEYMLQLELSAMQQEGRGEVVSSPRVITSDQKKATIKQGVEIPYQEATSSGATNVSFKEAVLKLEVTPRITPDDRVILDLIVSKDNPDFSREVLGVPPVDTRSVETSVLIDNGETVVLGGVFEESRTVGEEKVPFFGDLPGLGHLFRNDTTNRAKQELLIFVTPKILQESLSLRR